MSGSSLFYESGPRLDKDVFVQQLAWSNVDPLAALACNACDDRGQEIGQIVFINNEGTLLNIAPISHPKDASVELKEQVQFIHTSLKLILHGKNVNSHSLIGNTS